MSRKRRHRRRAYQSFGHRARVIRRNAEPVHAGIDLQVDVDADAQARPARACAPARLSWTTTASECAGDVVAAPPHRKSLRAAGSGADSRRARSCNAVSSSISASPSAVRERRQHAAHAVAIRIRLDDRQHFRAGRHRAYHARDCRRVRRDRRARRAGGSCARGTALGALSATARKEEAAGAKALGRRVRSWYKAPAAHVRIITIDSERQSRQKPRSAPKAR